MKPSLCGANCAECPTKETCKGCAETNGCPFGKPCFLADCIKRNGLDAYHVFQKKMISEINSLAIPGMETVTTLFPLVGHDVNLEYPLPNGNTVKFLKDDEMYLGTQVSNLSDPDKKTCFGVIARENFLLICEYGENGANPKIVLYQSRDRLTEQSINCQEMF